MPRSRPPLQPPETPVPASAPEDSAPEAPSNVIALSPLKAQLLRGRRLRRIDRIFETDDPKFAIRSLPGDEFYYLIEETGLDEAGELLRYATPNQIQVALDFAIWEGDMPSPAALEPWLRALMEFSAESVVGWIKGLDIELFAWLLRKRTIVHDVSENEGEIPEHIEGAYYRAPDSFFVFEMTGDDEQNRVTHGLLEALYSVDLNWARHVFVGVRYELDAELEELAYRWRTGRMADLGFLDPHEAMAVYREVDPAKIRIGSTPLPRMRPVDASENVDSLRMPSPLVEQLESGRGLFARSVAALTGRDEVAEIQFALATLGNQILAADRVKPTESDRVNHTLTRMSATLDLAMEFLCRGREADGPSALRTIPLATIFSVGTSLIGKVKRLALALRTRSAFAVLRPDVDLLEPDDAELFDALTALRPQFPRILDNPAQPGVRPFASMADLATVTLAVERVGTAVALLLVLGVAPAQLGPDERLHLGLKDPQAIDTGLLGRTALVLRLLTGGATAFRGLSEIEDAQLARSLGTDSGRKDLEAALASVVAPLAEGAAARAILAQWAQEILDGAALVGPSDDPA